MIKKVLLAGAVATVLTGGIAGVAYAHDADGDNGNNSCDSTESHHQENNDNEQAAGGNADVDRLSGGFIQGQVDKFPGVCPSGNALND